MVTINLSEEVKERFKKEKLKHSAKKNKSISENDFQVILLDNFEVKKK